MSMQYTTANYCVFPTLHEDFLLYVYVNDAQNLRALFLFVDVSHTLNSLIFISCVCVCVCVCIVVCAVAGNE